MKYTDYKQVKQLAANILKDDKKMLQLTSELTTRLKTLKTSFQDDGIDEIDAYVSGLAGKLGQAQNAFMTIANELSQYASILESGKR